MLNWKYCEPKFEYSKDLASSWQGHIFFAYDLIRNIKPRRVVELGTHYGISFFSMCQAVKDASLDTEMVAVDTWEGDPHAQQGYGEKDVVFNIFKKEIDSNYKSLNIKIHRKFFDDAAKEFGNGSIDILHIDGFHTYEAVKHDFETWLPKMNEDGIILFHDIHERKKDFGVYKLWEEIKKKYDTTEFYHWHGLGVLFLDRKTKSDFIEREDEWKGFYNNISERLLAEMRNEEFKNTINLLKENHLKEKDLMVAEIKNSKSFRIGDLFFRSIKKPWKVITLPINIIRILIKK